MKYGVNVYFSRDFNGACCVRNAAPLFDIRIINIHYDYRMSSGWLIVWLVGIFGFVFGSQLAHQFISASQCSDFALTTATTPECSEQQIKAPVSRETQQTGTVTTSWQSGRQRGARPQRHLDFCLRLASTQHNHCIPRSQNNLKPMSEKWREDHEGVYRYYCCA